MSTRVSIVIPVFNSEKFLAECLNSVLIQEHQNIECIIVDDHSTDGTYQIIEEYMRKFPGKFSYILNTRKGACAARNIGIEAATGEFVKFLDSDDVLDNEVVIYEQLLAFKESGADLVFGNETYYRNDFSERSLLYRRNITFKDIHSDFFNNRPITSNFIIKKKSIGDLRWPETLKSGQEFYFLFLCYLKALHFFYLDKQSAKIRAHESPNRISNAPKSLYIQQHIVLIQEMEKRILQSEKIHPRFLLYFKLWRLMSSYVALRNGFAKESRIIKPDFTLFEIFSFKSVKQVAFASIQGINYRLSYYLYRALGTKYIPKKFRLKLL